MRTIIKGSEPKSLTTHRSSPHATYANYQNKADLRQSLVSEQHGLCCYCMRRIRKEDDTTAIEHWHPQSRYPSEQLDYKNLLATCSGKTNKELHCGASKADKILSKNPANPQHRVEELILYRSNGEIASDDELVDAELNGVLRLNLPFLVSSRKATLDGLIDFLSKNSAITLKVRDLKKHIKEWSGQGDTGELEEYCQVIIYWLQKRLRRS
jgi:uncharacterized protein (TIGR02646 family)